MINLNGPKTLVLQPATIARMLDALAKEPYKDVVAAFNEILPQLQEVPNNAPGSE